MTPPDSARLDAIEIFFKEPVWGKPCGAAHLQADRLGLDACAIARRFEADKVELTSRITLVENEVRRQRERAERAEKERDAAIGLRDMAQKLTNERLCLIEDLKGQVRQARAEAEALRTALHDPELHIVAPGWVVERHPVLKAALSRPSRGCANLPGCGAGFNGELHDLKCPLRPERGEAICIDKCEHEAHWVNLDEYRRQYCSGKAPLAGAGTAKAETGMFVKKRIPVRADKAIEPGYIETLEGKMRVERGDWIVTGVRGEKYPVKADIFAETYEPAAEAPAPKKCRVRRLGWLRYCRDHEEWWDGTKNPACPSRKPEAKCKHRREVVRCLECKEGFRTAFVRDAVAWMNGHEKAHGHIVSWQLKTLRRKGA